MKRTTTIVLAAAIALSMTACTALDSILGINLFAGLAAVDESDIKDANASELIDLSSSDSFYDTLADKPELKVEVLEKIDLALVSADPLSADYQELAFLAATIELQTTPAGELVNNVSGLFDTLISTDDGAPAPELETLIEGIIPDSVINDDGSIKEVAFVDMINGLVEAEEYFILLSGALVQDPVTGDYDYADGVDFTAGDVAQAAIVSSLVASIDVPAGYESVYPTTGDYLFALLTAPDTTPTATFVEPDFETGYLSYLLLAANLDFSTTTP
jgi:hypothetical protein